MSVLEKIAILFKVRSMSGDDPKLEGMWATRKEMITKDPDKQKTLIEYPSYPDASDPEVKEFCAAVNQELSLYKGKKGIFARSWVIDSAKSMPAHLWWDQNGASVPELQAFARMVLAQPASASICERINSEFEFVKDRRRNRLSHDKANLLVDLFHNLRLLKRMKKLEYTEPAIAWSDDVEKSAVTRYEPGKSGGSSLLLKQM